MDPIRLTCTRMTKCVIVLALSIVVVTNAASEPRPVDDRGPIPTDEQLIIDLFEASSPSVAHITTVQVRRDRFSLNLFEIPQGTGSGFVWDTQGHIVTNYHVLQGAQLARVTLSDQTTWDAKLVGVAPDKDLAVIKIEASAEELRAIPLGVSKDLKVGQKVLAIGNPFGLDQTLTTGIISGLGREINSRSQRPIQDVIQTDAAINPGNSGGPLLDSAGRLIGVNTAIFSPSGAYAGVGFAVPVDTVNRIVPELIEHGRVIRPGFGVRIDNGYLNRRLRVTGVIIMDVIPRSAAADAGMKGMRWGAFGRYSIGDTIVAIDGEDVKDGNGMLTILEEYEVGDEVTVTLRCKGKVRNVQVKLRAVN